MHVTGNKRKKKKKKDNDLVKSRMPCKQLKHTGIRLRDAQVEENLAIMLFPNTTLCKVLERLCNNLCHIHLENVNKKVCNIWNTLLDFCSFFFCQGLGMSGNVHLQEAFCFPNYNSGSDSDCISAPKYQTTAMISLSSNNHLKWMQFIFKLLRGNVRDKCHRMYF